MTPSMPNRCNMSTNDFELVEDNTVMTTAQYFDLRINDVVKLVALIIANAEHLFDDGRPCDRSDLGYVRIYRYTDVRFPNTRIEYIDLMEGVPTKYLSFELHSEALAHILRVFW